MHALNHPAKWRLSVALTGLLAVAIAVPAAAQEAAEPTVEGYLCIFAGKCADGEGQPGVSVVANTVSTDADSDDGISEGFRIARPGTPQQQQARPATHQKPEAPLVRTSTGKPKDRRNLAPASIPPRNLAPAVNTAPVSGAQVVQAPRADLRIGFELNSSRLTADGEKKARIFAQSLMMPELSGKRFVIEGHTDSQGAIALNMNLSQQRAQAVADFLARQGVDRSRMQVSGYGPGIPLPGLRTTDTRNRRVEAKLIS